MNAGAPFNILLGDVFRQAVQQMTDVVPQR
jgi:hypothetical protein